MTEYVETGGLRWGESYWRAANATWPFAKVRISQGPVQLRMKGWGWDLTFDLEKSELLAVRRRRGLFAVGVQFEHQKPDYPPFLLFWTFRPKTIFRELRRLGCNIL